MQKSGLKSAQPSLMWIYFSVLGTVVLIWFLYMLFANQWHLFATHWQISLTMLFGSFVAGSTPQGGAVVAFPVFTKLLQISAPDSRTFGFMIQAVGMVMASIMILVRRIKILPHVILWVSLGGFAGTWLGTYFLILPALFPRILFTIGATSFAVALVISRWVLPCSPKSGLPAWNMLYKLGFLAIGIVGGVFSAQTGSGADMITFIVLTLTFGINEKISTPTTVIIMGINSVFGFLLHGVFIQDIGQVWNFWLVAIPIVSLGAPIGAFVVSLIDRDVLISFILLLIVVELVSTLILISFSAPMIVTTVVAVSACAISFFMMLAYRQQNIAIAT